MSIITFYSYKGGVGRTMALANVAVALARTHRVLVVDWDLEAPGIERYFAELRIQAEGWGLIALLSDVASRRQPAYRDYLCEVTALDSPLELSLLPSGRETDPDYYQKLESFEWAAFYRGGGGDYLERLREQWLTDFDFVLIDSRTGLSDAGGVCTILLPDIVVAMCTPAHQSLYGVRDVMRLAQQARHRLAYDRTALSIIPVPSRVDRTHPSYADWRKRFVSELGEFLSAWLPRAADRAAVLDRLAIAHEPGVAHGERLVVLSSSRELATLRASYERLTTLLASDLGDLSPVIDAPPPDARPRTKPRSLTPRGLEAAPTTSTGWRGSTDYEYDIFLSYRRTSVVSGWLIDHFLPSLRYRIDAELGRMPDIFMDHAEVAVADRWVDAQRSALTRSRLLLAMLSPSYFQSRWCQAELETFLQRSQITGQLLLVPVVISRGESLSRITNQFAAVDMADFVIAGQGFKKTVRYVEFLDSVRQLGRTIAEHLGEAPRFDPAWSVVEPEMVKTDAQVPRRPRFDRES